MARAPNPDTREVMEIDWPFFGEVCRALALKVAPSLGVLNQDRSLHWNRRKRAQIVHLLGPQTRAGDDPAVPACKRGSGALIGFAVLSEHARRWLIVRQRKLQARRD